MEEPMSDQQRSSSRKIAWRQGILFGLGIGIIDAMLVIVTFVASFPYRNYFLYAVMFVGFLWAGMLAAQKTGAIRSGSLAGLWAGLLASIIGSIVNIIIFSIVGFPGFNTPKSVIAFNTIVGTLLAIFVTTCIATVLGALGGIIGKSRVRISSTSRR